MCTFAIPDFATKPQLDGLLKKCLSPTVGNRTHSNNGSKENRRSDGVCLLPARRKIATKVQKLQNHD